MKKLLLLTFLFSSHTFAGSAEIQTLMMRENRLRLDFSNLMAAHNEVPKKEYADDIINRIDQGIIKTIITKNVKQSQCDSIAEYFYTHSDDQYELFLKPGIDKKLVDRYVLSTANYIEAVCNAYITKDQP